MLQGKIQARQAAAIAQAMWRGNLLQPQRCDPAHLFEQSTALVRGEWLRREWRPLHVNDTAGSMSYEGCPGLSCLQQMGSSALEEVFSAFCAVCSPHERTRAEEAPDCFTILQTLRRPNIVRHVMLSKLCEVSRERFDRGSRLVSLQNAEYVP